MIPNIQNIQQIQLLEEEFPYNQVIVFFLTLEISAILLNALYKVLSSA